MSPLSAIGGIATGTAGFFTPNVANGQTPYASLLSGLKGAYTDLTGNSTPSGGGGLTPNPTPDSGYQIGDTPVPNTEPTGVVLDDYGNPLYP